MTDAQRIRAVTCRQPRAPERYQARNAVECNSTGLKRGWRVAIRYVK